MNPDPESARRQGQNDANQNNGPAQTHAWDAVRRAEYDAAYQRQQQENNNRNK